MSLSGAERLSGTSVHGRSWHASRVLVFRHARIARRRERVRCLHCMYCAGRGCDYVGVGALTDALLNGFERQGRVLLGGDVTLRRVHQRASEAERSEIARIGRMAETATMRSMARTSDGNEQALVEIKAVDTSYPMLGKVRLAGGGEFVSAVHQKPGAVVAQSLLDRLQPQARRSDQTGQFLVPITVHSRVRAGQDHARAWRSGRGSWSRTRPWPPADWCNRER